MTLLANRETNILSKIIYKGFGKYNMSLIRKKRRAIQVTFEIAI